MATLATYPNVEAVFDAYSKKVTNQMKAKLDGTSIQSALDIHYYWYTMDKNLINLTLNLPKYWYWADQGRGPGKPPPPDPIKRWMDHHSIPLSALDGIRWNIAHHGTIGRDFVHYFSDGYNQLIKDLSKAILIDTGENLKNALQVAFTSGGAGKADMAKYGLESTVTVIK